jgi:octanoyl-[GcvH]:protein N-octanoyltransferase
MSEWREEFSRFYSPWQVVDDTAELPEGQGTSVARQSVEGQGALAPSEEEWEAEERAGARIRRDVELAGKLALEVELAGKLALEVAGQSARSPSLPSPLFRIWVNEPCLVTTRREARLPRFEAAAQAARARGWPVFVRDSGGTTIPHLRESLHLSLLLPRIQGDEPGTDRVYTFLCEPVREALALLGVEAGYGVVPNSFCDGRFNLVAQGRKVAGTSQRWKGGIPGHPVGKGFILAHMTLFVGGNMAHATGQVNRFLREAGGEGDFDPHAVVTVRELEALPVGVTGDPEARVTGDPTGSDAGPPMAGPVMARVRNALRRVLGD